MPQFHVNFIAIIVAVIAHFVLGFLWYTPIFGKVWAAEMKFPSDFKPSPKLFIGGMITMLIGNFLMAWVLYHNMAAWNPLSWGLPAGPLSPVANGLMAGIFTWLGFFLPVDLGTIFWENKSMKLFFINTGYHLCSTVLVAMILAMMW